MKDYKKPLVISSDKQKGIFPAVIAAVGTGLAAGVAAGFAAGSRNIYDSAVKGMTPQCENLVLE